VSLIDTEKNRPCSKTLEIPSAPVGKTNPRTGHNRRVSFCDLDSSEPIRTSSPWMPLRESEKQSQRWSPSVSVEGAESPLITQSPTTSVKEIERVFFNDQNVETENFGKLVPQEECDSIQGRGSEVIRDNKSERDSEPAPLGIPITPVVMNKTERVLSYTAPAFYGGNNSFNSDSDDDRRASSTPWHMDMSNSSDEEEVLFATPH